jgi:branched-chain amino acid transport system substrate-binding protein
MKTKAIAAALGALTALALASGAALAQQGVSKTEITLGSIQDLSGPAAGFGKQARNGMILRVDELNEQGAIHGRKLKLIVEDSSYDPRKAVLAAQKLVNQDRIFAMVQHIGTAHNNAALPVQLEKNVVNWFPLTSSRDMYEPFHKLKFAFAASYFDQMRAAVPRLVKEKNLKKPCAIYQDDDFGLEVMRGGEAGLKGIGMAYAESTSYKRGATDFSSQVARMKAAGCDLVVMGTIIRETVGTIAESRKTGFSPTFLGSNAAYTDLIHKLGGKAMDGLYATMTLQHPYLDEASPQLRFWANKYKTRFNEDPTVFSLYGYTAVDAFVQVANKAGPNLTPDSFVKAAETHVFPTDIFGSPESRFGPSRRQGSDVARLSQLQDARWRVVSEYFKPGQAPSKP